VKYPAKSILMTAALLATPVMAGTLILEGGVAQPAAAASPAVSTASSQSGAKTTPAPSAPAVELWEVKPADGTLSRAMLRWSRDAAVQLSYEAPDDLPAIAVAYTGDFWTAMDSLLKDSNNGSYPLHGCQYTNVVRILHTSQACDR
jgi:hypothetical protein